MSGTTGTVLATLAGVIASGMPFALLACHRDPGPLADRDRLDRGERRRAQDDRDLLRLARNHDRRRRRNHP
ncbi:hypothetical protein [Streptomyces sp. GQFP]|uniref:hypothetical protein n=1 Tax=Streptomyces sp. GQFP TaxID=2907545 RepID=UPI001F457220|nr:hypothetical protein [Streptomyces sp. GQFP]UIX33564.1 hypothetical protein LUX31_28145 [Streptomyces sp. GQFP]